jgi:hypothetical protein
MELKFIINALKNNQWKNFTDAKIAYFNDFY